MTLQSLSAFEECLLLLSNSTFRSLPMLSARYNTLYQINILHSLWRDSNLVHSRYKFSWQRRDHGVGRGRIKVEKFPQPDGATGMSSPHDTYAFCVELTHILVRTKTT